MSIWSIVPNFSGVSSSKGQVAYVLRTRSPVSIAEPLNLHVLSPPLAFVLSQDQTLHCVYFELHKMFVMNLLSRYLVFFLILKVSFPASLRFFRLNLSSNDVNELFILSFNNMSLFFRLPRFSFFFFRAAKVDTFF